MLPTQNKAIEMIEERKQMKNYKYVAVITLKDQTMSILAFF